LQPVVWRHQKKGGCEMKPEQIDVGSGSASDVKAGSAEISFGEFRRLEGLTPSAKAFVEQHAGTPDNYVVVITNGKMEIRAPR
jgi:hypothetical protein